MVKHVVKKVYVDVENEENWLNSMSAMGMALIDYTWCRYVFERAQPNEYIYRIELLEKPHTHPESLSYIQFLEENGIECVAGYMRWIFLRKKASDGPFDLYTDAESRYRYYKRLFVFYNSLFVLNAFAGTINLGIALLVGSTPNFICAAICLPVVALMTRIIMPVQAKMRKYEQEKIIRE